MMKRKKILSVLLICVLCMGGTFTVQADDISDAKEEQERLEQEKKDAEAEQAELSAKLDAIVADMEKTQEDLYAKENEINETETQLVEAKVRENDQYESMKLRIKYMYENGNNEFIEILMESSSIGDLLNKAEYINKISECDRQLLTEYENTRKEIEEKEATLKQEYAELEALRDELKAQEADVQALLKEKDLEIENLTDEISENAEKIKKLVAEAKAAEERRKQEEAAKKAAAASGSSSGGGNGQIVVSGNGQLSHPVPGARITSDFGYRVAPTAGATSRHDGIDYGASTGTPIYAADGGTVITAAYNSARGNYVVINHGNGMQTWYQHCSAMYVSAGQTVSRGQNIAAVGATGIVTGPHLHFEVHVGGVPVNPRLYI